MKKLIIVTMIAACIALCAAVWPHGNAVEETPVPAAGTAVSAKEATVAEIEECHRALSEALGKPERRLVLRIIDAKDRIAEDTSIDSFIAGFELAWKLSIELNHYENEHSVSCRTAMGLGARFASAREEEK